MIYYVCARLNWLGVVVKRRSKYPYLVLLFIESVDSRKVYYPQLLLLQNLTMPNDSRCGYA